MKSTGIIRSIDDLGRIVIPKEIRNSLDIQPGQNLELFIENDFILLKKFNCEEETESLLNKAMFYIEENLHLSMKEKYEIYSNIKKIKEKLNEKTKDNRILSNKNKDDINQKMKKVIKKEK